MTSRAEMDKERERFSAWVKEYGVYKNVSEDLFEFSNEDSNFVWTEFQNDDESFVDRGFTQASPSLRMPVVSYYLSKLPYPKEGGGYEFVISSVLLDCQDCEAMGEDENGDECSTCEGNRGNYFDFDLPGP